MNIHKDCNHGCPVEHLCTTVVFFQLVSRPMRPMFSAWFLPPHRLLRFHLPSFSRDVRFALHAPHEEGRCAIHGVGGHDRVSWSQTVSIGGHVGGKPYLHHMDGGSTDTNPHKTQGGGVNGRRRHGWMGHGVGECIAQEHRPPSTHTHACMHVCMYAHGCWCGKVGMSWVPGPRGWIVRPTHARSHAMRIQPLDRSVWKTIGTPEVDLRCLEMLDNNAAPSVTSTHAGARLDVGDSPWVEEVSERPYDGTWFHRRCTVIVACTQGQLRFRACEAYESSSL